MNSQLGKAPTIRYKDLCSRCVKTIESAHKSGLERAFCQSCGATLKHDGLAWEIEHRAPVSQKEAS